MRLLALTAAVFALTACGPSFDRVDITGVVPSDLGGHIDTASLTVPEGLALKATIAALDDDNDFMSLDVRSDDSTIVDVEPVVTPRAFTFVGRKAGHTNIVFRADGHVVLTVGADVTPQ